VAGSLVSSLDGCIKFSPRLCVVCGQLRILERAKPRRSLSHRGCSSQHPIGLSPFVFGAVSGLLQQVGTVEGVVRSTDGFLTPRLGSGLTGTKRVEVVLVGHRLSFH
jgi:hypothetical protein